MSTEMNLDEAITYLRPIAESATVGRYAEALGLVLAAAGVTQPEPTDAQVEAARKAIHRALAPNWMTVVQALDGNQHEYEAFIDTIADAALTAALTAGQEEQS